MLVLLHGAAGEIQVCCVCELSSAGARLLIALFSHSWARLPEVHLALAKFDGIGAGVYAADWIFTLFSRLVRFELLDNAVERMMRRCLCLLAARVRFLSWPKCGTVFCWRAGQ